MKLNVRNYALMASMATVIALAGSASAQRFYLSLPGSGGADAPSVITAAADGRFEVEVWFDNNSGADIAGRTSAGIQLGYDKSTTSGTSAVRMQNILNPDGATNAGASSGAMTGGSANFTNWLAPSIRGGANTAAGTNNPNAGAERPWGLNTSQGNLDAGGFTIAAGAKIKMFGIKMIMTGGDGWYGNDNSEAGLIVYKHKDRTTENSVSFGQSGFGPGPALFAGSQKYSVRIVPEPMTMIALGAGVAALISRRRKNS